MLGLILGHLSNVIRTFNVYLLSYTDHPTGAFFDQRNMTPPIGPR